MQVIAPKVAAHAFKRVIWKLFQQPGHWAALVGNQHIPPPMGDTLQSSIRRLYDWGMHTVYTVPVGELAIWLAEYCFGTRKTVVFRMYTKSPTVKTVNGKESETLQVSVVHGCLGVRIFQEGMH